MDILMQKEHLIHGNHALFSSTFKPLKEQLRERADPAFVRRLLDTFLTMFEKRSLSLSFRFVLPIKPGIIGDLFF